MAKRPRAKAANCEPLEDAIQKTMHRAGTPGKVDNPYFACALKRFRYEHPNAEGNPMTQRELLSFLNAHGYPIGDSTLRGYESLDSVPTDNLDRLASILGISTSKLCTGVEQDLADVRIKTGLSAEAVTELHRLRQDSAGIDEYTDEVLPPPYPNGDITRAFLDFLLSGDYLYELDENLGELISAYNSAPAGLLCGEVERHTYLPINGAMYGLTRSYERMLESFALRYSDYQQHNKEETERLKEGMQLGKKAGK